MPVAVLLIKAGLMSLTSNDAMTLNYKCAELQCFVVIVVSACVNIKF